MFQLFTFWWSFIFIHCMPQLRCQDRDIQYPTVKCARKSYLSFIQGPDTGDFFFMADRFTNL